MKLAMKPLGILSLSSLVLGALTLGLAGCGGGSDSNNNLIDITRPINVTVRGTSVPTNGTPGNSGATINSGAALSGGVQVATVTLNSGNNIGIELFGAGDTVLNSASNDDKNNFGPIAEFVLGLQTGSTIDPTQNGGMTGTQTVTITADPATIQQIQNAMNGGRDLQVRVVTGTGGNGMATLFPGAHATISGNTIVVTGVTSGDFVIVLTTQSHQQIGIG